MKRYSLLVVWSVLCISMMQLLSAAQAGGGADHRSPVESLLLDKQQLVAYALWKNDPALSKLVRTLVLFERLHEERGVAELLDHMVLARYIASVKEQLALLLQEHEPALRSYCGGGFIYGTGTSCPPRGNGYFNNVDIAGVLTAADVILGELTVTGSSTLVGNVGIGANLSVAGNTLLNTLHVTGDSLLDGRLDVGGDGTIGGTLTVSGTGTFEDDVAFLGDISVAGDLSVAGNTLLNFLHVAGDSLLDGDLDVGGDETVGGSLIVTGTADIGADLTVGNLITAVGTITSTTGNVQLGTTAAGFVLGNGVKVLSGTGDPNGAVTAPQGSLYLRTNGTTTNDRAYINTDGVTAWTAIITAA